jgi:hypothetical protein
VTVEEELAKLEDNIRRLKIEYETYFSGGQPRPPHDTVFRVDTTIKKFSDNTGRLNFGQRFKFNQLVQKYAVYNDLWRRKMKAVRRRKCPADLSASSARTPKRKKRRSINSSRR